MSESTRFTKSIPKLPRVVNQVKGRQLGLRLPIKRLMSWPTLSWNMSPGVNARYPFRYEVVRLMKPFVLYPGPPYALDVKPVVLFSVCGRRCELEIKTVETATSARGDSWRFTLPRNVARVRALGRSCSPGMNPFLASSRWTSNSGTL